MLFKSVSEGILREPLEQAKKYPINGALVGGIGIEICLEIQ
jgi:hypothetical protein